MLILGLVKKIYLLTLGLATLCLIVLVSLLWQKQSPSPQNQDLNPISEPTPILNEKLTNQTEKSLEASMATYSARVQQIEMELASLRQQLATNSAVKSAPKSSSFVKDTLYLGSSSTQSREWKETSLEIGINSAHYPSDVSVRLETALSIIGGEAWVRLKNKSTGAVIPLSEISHNTSITTWKLSPSFKLHPGGYTYVLEARSTSGEVANISGARLIVE